MLDIVGPLIVGMMLTVVLLYRKGVQSFLEESTADAFQMLVTPQPGDRCPLVSNSSAVSAYCTTFVDTLKEITVRL